MKKNIQNAKVIPHEYTHIKKDKKRFSVNVHSSKIKYNGEDAQISIVRDITERKQIEEALCNSEDLLNNILEFLPDATFVIDQNKKVIAWNKALEIMTNTSKKDILGKGGAAYSNVFYEEPRPALADLVEKEDIDIKLYDSIEWKKNCLVVETFISDGVRQYGYSPETLLGKPVIELVYHEDKNSTKDRMNERRTRGRRTRSFEVRLLTKDQENIFFEIFSVSAEGLYASESPTQDTFMGTQGIARDITERKLGEQEREKMIIDLQDALENVKTLSGLVPICATCKKIRDDKGYWNQIEAHIEKYSNAKFSHGMCPGCSDKLYGKEDWFNNHSFPILFPVDKLLAISQLMSQQ